jgi:hypothetical protein
MFLTAQRIQIRGNAVGSVILLTGQTSAMTHFDPLIRRSLDVLQDSKPSGNRHGTK